MKASIRVHKTNDRMILNIFGVICVTFLAVLCLLPFVLILSASLTDETSIIQDGYRLIPGKMSFQAYDFLFKHPEQLVQAYFITMLVTIIGTIAGLFLTAMTAYALQRQDFKWRNTFSFFFFFTTLFSGGLVPYYLLIINYLHLKNTLAVLILPGLLNVFHIMIMKTFMRSIPDAITESAKIDGAGDFKIFISLILPLSKPALATIGLFAALGIWNDWYTSLLFITDNKLMPLQYYLYRMLGNMDGLKKAMLQSGVVLNIELPTESLKMAMTIIATGPIFLVYPFVQRYFVQGLTIGAVKG